MIVEPTFWVVLAVAFVLGVVLILRNAPSSKEEPKPKKEKKPKAPKVKKGPKNSLKKDKRPADIKEWTGIDTAAKDAQEMLEFLKGKDPAEIAKQNKQQQNNNKKKPQQPQPNNKKGGKAAESASEDSANDSVSDEGFSVIKTKKPKTDKTQKNQKKDAEKKKEDKPRKQKAFLKDEVKPDDQQKGEKKPRRERKGDKVEDGEQAHPLQQERKKRGNGDDAGEGNEKREKKDRPPRERQRKPATVAPIVPKYEQADLTDILNSITQDFKAKPKGHQRISTVFSKIPRHIVVNHILSKLEARDLVALSRVNHYFWLAAKGNSLWNDLLHKDFGVRDVGKYRNSRAAYKGEYKKRNAAKKQPTEEAAN